MCVGYGATCGFLAILFFPVRISTSSFFSSLSVFGVILPLGGNPRTKYSASATLTPHQASEGREEEMHFRHPAHASEASSEQRAASSERSELVKSQKFEKKRRITGSTVTPMYGGFRHPELDTVADSTRRIFFVRRCCSGTGPDQGRRQVKSQKRQKKGEHWIHRNSNVWRFQTLIIGQGGGFDQAHLFVRRYCSGTVQNTPSQTIRTP